MIPKNKKVRELKTKEERPKVENRILSFIDESFNISEEYERGADEDMDFSMMFHIYSKKYSGKHSFAKFRKNMGVFFDLTVDAYIVGEGSREVAFNSWVAYIKSYKEAGRYFRASDDFSTYS